MKKYKIEKGIKMPERAIDKFPFREMVVGDSFLVPFTDMASDRPRLCSYILSAKLKGFGNFKTKKEAKGIRVWKISEGIKL